MRSWIICFLLSSTALLSSQAQDLRKTPAAQAACGPPETTFHVDMQKTSAAPPTEPGKAVLYVIQRGGFTSKLGLDGQWIGAVSGASYIETTVAPGEHHLCVAWQSHEKGLSEKVVLHGLKAVAGQTYYFVTQLMSQGGNAYEITLQPADSDDAKMRIEGYSQATATIQK